MEQRPYLTLSLFGYNRNQVDQYVASQQTQVAQLEARITELEQTLVDTQDKLTHYLEIEQALTDGIVDARVKGQEIMDQSQSQADRLINQTNEQVIQYKEEFAHNSRQLVANGQSLKEELNAMKKEMRTMIARYQTLIEETDFDKVFPAKQVDQFVEQVSEYEQDRLVTPILTKHQSEEQLSQEEKAELTRLISDVTAHEGQKKGKKSRHAKKKNKLVALSAANEA